MTESSLLQDGAILFGVAFIGLFVGLAIGGFLSSTYAGYKCHPETDPVNVSGIVIDQYTNPNGAYFYIDLKGDDGTIRTVMTDNIVIARHIKNGTFYKFTLKRSLTAYYPPQIDQQVYP